MFSKFLIVTVIGSLGLAACAPGRRNTNPVKASADKNLKTDAPVDTAGAGGGGKQDPIVIFKTSNNGSKVTHYDITLPDQKSLKVELADGSDKATITSDDGIKSEAPVTVKKEGDKKITSIQKDNATITHVEELGRPVSLSLDQQSEFGFADHSMVKYEDGKNTIIVDDITLASKEYYLKNGSSVCSIADKICVGHVEFKSEDKLIKVSAVDLPQVTADGKKISYAEAQGQNRIGRDANGIQVLLAITIDGEEKSQQLQLDMLFSEPRSEVAAVAAPADLVGPPAPPADQAAGTPEQKLDKKLQSGRTSSLPGSNEFNLTEI